ncbi:TRAP transporter small permease [Marinobacter halodurans]|uniref:TRAP transporter small permease protein n=1 Tax=Marinobacter halodurans TaxID=2528979 RepID=A0ABY1ZRE0_9GAMM|nr:TRAP transporter small permease [Marinobacter halodurans]TBW58419.1 TRAP transporter small permease [Marinobacter halodurans]
MTSTTVGLYSRVEALVTGAARILIVFSGLLLISAILITCSSIAGRSLTPIGLSAIPGDYELVEILCGLAVFSFMPYCQLFRGHISVDLFIERLGPRAMAWTQLLGDVVMSGLVTVMAWRHFAGTLDKHAYGETSFILQIPVWWSYAAAMVLLVLFWITSLFTVWRDIVALHTGSFDVHPAPEDEHA